MPLPNVVAVAPPKVVRPFVAPPVKPVTPPEAAPLADAPRVAAADVKARVGAAGCDARADPAGHSRLRPNVRMQRQAMLQLPEGPRPEMVVEPDALPFPDAGPQTAAEGVCCAGRKIASGRHR